MKILFIYPPANPAAIEDSSYPLGLLYIAKILEEKGHEVVVKDYFKDPWDSVKNEIINFVKKFSPDILGLSCITMNRTSNFNLARIFKKIKPELKIIMGGVHATTLYNQILSEFPIDIVVSGEGEITMSDLVETIEKDKPLRNVKGIAFKKDDKIIFTGHRKPIKDLDKLPFPKHEFCEDRIKKNKKAIIITSRGCPFGCLFCSTSAYWGKKLRTRSAKNVVDEIEYLIKRFPYIEEIGFHDDEFTMDNQRVIDICDEILKRKIKIKWSCSARVDRISEKMLIKMKQAGCINISYGVESGSQKMLDNINKKITLEQTKSTINLTNKVGISYHPFMIAGVPGETWDTIKETVKFIKQFKNFDIGNGIGRLQLYPNTPIYEIAKKQGIIDDLYWIKNDDIPFYTHEHSEEELSKMAYYVIEKNQQQQGMVKFLRFSFNFLVKKPKKAIKYLLLRTGLRKTKKIYNKK